MAARRRARNESSPSSSLRSASSSSWSASSSFLGRVVDTSSDDTEVRACVCLPTYNERENLEPMRALGDVLGLDDRVLVIDDSSPTGPASCRPPGGRARLRRRAAPAAQGGPRPGVPRGFRRALDAGAELIVEIDCDFSHDPTTCRGSSPPQTTPTSCSARATCRAAESRTGGRPPRDLGRRLDLRAACARRAGPRPDRRLRVLPPPRLEAIPLDRVHCAATPSRSR